MRFVKNENYWAGEANLDEIYLQFVPDDASQTAALVAGDADLGTFPPCLTFPFWKRVACRSWFRVRATRRAGSLTSEKWPTPEPGT